MLPYNPIENPNTFLECCEPDPNPNNHGSGDCCYDFWQADKAYTDGELKSVIAIAEMKQKKFEAISDWHDMLKTWCNDWETADKYADTLCRNLEWLSKHLSKIGQITEKTAEAIELLFCMIKELYIKVDLLKERYDDIYKCIKCLKAPELESGGIRTCLDDYGVKLIAVIATRDDIISKVIIAIELSYELHDNLSDKYGLTTILEYWKGIFKCCEETGNSDEESDCEPDDDNNHHCELRPIVTFPIEQSIYFNKLKELRHETKKKYLEAKTESYDANENKAAMQALSDGLNNAITSVTNSNKCK